MDAESFYSTAYTRILRFMLAFMIAGVIFFTLYKQKWLLLVYVAGSVLAFLNVHWLKSFVDTMAKQIVEAKKKPKSGSVVRRFLLRYVLIASIAYAIFKIYPDAVVSLFAGLLLPVGGILCEAGYELLVALKHGI